MTSGVNRTATRRRRRTGRGTGRDSPRNSARRLSVPLRSGERTPDHSGRVTREYDTVVGAGGADRRRRKMPTYTTHTIAETEAVAASLGLSLRAGACVAVSGDLGAGKTQFVRG